MSVRSRHAQRKRNSSQRELPVLSAFATTLALVCALLGSAAAQANSDAAEAGYRRTLDFGTKAFEVQLHYGNEAPGSAAVAGEGSVRTTLPGEGHLTLRVPHVLGSRAALGDAQLGASYDLVAERRLLPSLGVVADVDLPTSPGTREVRPRLKATAAKSLGSGVVDSIRLEGECWTEGRERIPGYRATVGTTLRLFAGTRGSIELVSLQPPIASGAPRETLTQLGVAHRIGAGAAFRAGIATRVAGETRSISATIGIDRRF